MASPVLTLIGSGATNGVSGYSDTYNIGSTLPRGSMLFVLFEGAGTFSVSDSKGHAYTTGISTFLIFNDQLTAGLSATDTVTVTFTPNTDLVRFSRYYIYTLSNVSTQPSKYGISDAGASFYYAQSNSAHAISPGDTYSFTAAVSSYIASRGVASSKIGGSIAILFQKFGTSGSPLGPPDYIHDTATDSLTTLLAEVYDQGQVGVLGSPNYNSIDARYKIDPASNQNGLVASGSISQDVGGGISSQSFFYLVIFQPPQATGAKLSRVYDPLPNIYTCYIGVINASGQAVIYIDNVANPTTTIETSPTTVDAATNCSQPALAITPSGRLYYFYTQGTTLVYRTSDNRGITWSAAVTVTTTYRCASAIWCGVFPAVYLALMAWNSANNTWYAIGGTVDASGNLSLSGAVSTGLTGPEVAGQIGWRSDGVLEFVYYDGTNTKIARCSSFDPTTGAGSWV